MSLNNFSSAQESAALMLNSREKPGAIRLVKQAIDILLSFSHTNIVESKI